MTLIKLINADFLYHRGHEEGTGHTENIGEGTAATVRTAHKKIECRMVKSPLSVRNVVRNLLAPWNKIRDFEAKRIPSGFKCLYTAIVRA